MMMRQRRTRESSLQDAPSLSVRNRFLAGGGEMGARMRGFDWVGTPLGPTEGWPQSLKTAVRIMLTSRQPIWVGWGPDLTYLYNDAYQSIIGGKHPRALGQPTSVVWQELWPEIGPMLATAMTGVEGTYVEEQLLIMERNGYREETYYTFSYSPIPDDDGGAGGIICANSDDTKRVIGERELALLRELAAGTGEARSWREACQRSARALGGNPRDIPFAMIYVAEPDGAVLSLVGLSGLDEDHPAARPTLPVEAGSTWPLDAVLREHEVRVVSDLPAVLAGDPPPGAWSQPPSQAALLPILPTGDTGRAGVLIIGLNPFRLFDAGYRGFLGLVAGQIAAAIGNAQAYEEERRRAEALAEIDRAKTQFFTNVSHEFRTPLTLMLGPLEESLAVADRLPPDEAERVAVAHRNGLRLLRLVNSLLDFSRIEAGRTEATYEPTDLAGFTRELAESFRSATERAGLELVIDAPALAEPVYLDRDMWEKIVLNLLSNAFKFTFAGSIAVTVRPAAEGWVELAVSDTGTGIAAEELPRLFERFHRVEGAQGRSFEGSGIGLALVQELVRLHGGEVRAWSEPGQGSRFTVSVPLGSAHLPADRVGRSLAVPASAATHGESFVAEAARWLPPHGGAAAEIEAAAGRPGDGRRGRVLLADDNADMRAYIARLLAGEGFDVETAADGEAALAAARRQPPDLVLSDVMMPTLDGFGLLRELRADPSLRETPVVLLSARAGEEASTEGLVAGADDYLTKPFSARELVARVATNLNLARARREAAAAIRVNEERLRLIVDSAEEYAIITLGLDGRITGWNVGAERILGYREEEAIGQSGGIFFTPEDRAGGRPETEMRRARAEGRADNERWHMRRDGSRFWGSGVMMPLADDSPGYLQILRDRTAERRAEESLRESEARFRNLADAMPQLVWTADHEGRVDYYNARYRGYAGLRQTDARHWDWRPIVHPDDLPATAAAWETAVRSGAPYSREQRMRRADGAWAWHVSRAEPVKTPDGAILKWYGVSTDIDALKATQAALEALNANLETMVEQRTRERDRAWKNSRDLQLVLDPQGVFRAANGAWTSILGWRPDEILGHHYLEFIHPDDHPSSRVGLAIALEGELDPFENRYRHRNGGYRWISWVAGAEDGLIYANGRDITAQKAAVEEIAAANRQLVTQIEERQRVEETLAQMQRLEAVGQLTSGVAHDFNNLLTVIMGNVQYLSRLTSDERQRRRLDMMQQAAQRGAKLTGQLLAFSRRQRLEARPLDLNDTVTRMRELLQSSMGGMVRLTMSLHEDVWPALVDATQIELVILNLAINARDAMEVGGSLTVQTANVRLGEPTRPEEPPAGDYVMVAVGDTGTGMTPEVMAKAFEPFFTTKDVGRGSGLGLAQVFGFAKQSGGGVGIDTTLGQGTTVRVYLPRAIDNGASRHETLAHDNDDDAVPPADGARRHVLLVDDDGAVREVTATMLGELGFAVTEAGSGGAALDVLDREGDGIDLMLVDFAMPGMNGTEVARQARTRRRDLPILFITGYADLTALREVGEERIIQKPFQEGDLARKIRAALASPVDGDKVVHFRR